MKLNYNCPDLSVCIITWNVCELTMACIKSLIEQTKSVSYEIILVDNASTDCTLEKVRKEVPQVRIIANQINHGFTYANNQALKIATGKYSILLNNDMSFNMDALSKMVEFMDNNQDVGVLGCRLRLPNGVVQHSAHEDVCWQDYLYNAFLLHRLFSKSKIFGRINCTYINYNEDNLVVDTGWVAGAGLMVRTSSIKKVGLLDERIITTGEDWEWCRRFANHGYRIVYYTGPEIIHFHGVSTINYVGKDRYKIRKKSIMRAIAASHYVFRKLNVEKPANVFLFNLSFRIYCLSRALVFGLRNIIKPKSADYGSFLGYLIGVFINYRSLCKHHLRFENNEV